MRKFLVVTLVAVLTSLFCGVAFASTKEDAEQRLQNASDVLQQIMAAPDKGIPEEVLDGAKCVVVIPHMVKGGFIVGGRYGKGVATCRTTSGWSAPAFMAIGGGSFGFQIGAEGIDLVMVIMNQQGLDHLVSSKFQISGDASAAAGPVGRHASAGTDWKLNAEILTYSRSKGIFAGVSLDGAVIEKDDDATKAIYGQDLPLKSILTGKVEAPAVSATFLDSVRHAVQMAKLQ